MSISTLDFSSLKENQLTLSVKLNETFNGNVHVPMASNDNCVLLCPQGYLYIVDSQGKEHLNIQCDFLVNDMCWSCHQNKYLLLSGSTLYALGTSSTVKQNTKQPSPEQLTQITQLTLFSNIENPTICTCTQDTFIIIDSKTSLIHVYTMIDWKLVQKYEQPISCERNEEICTIRSNANGTRFGLVVRNTEDTSRGSFQLRHPYNMSTLKRIDLFNGSLGYCVVGLPISKDKFLLNEFKDKKLYLIDSYNHIDNDISQTIEYEDEKYITDTTLMNDEPNQWLVARKENQLCFYSVPRQKELDLFEL